MKQLSFKGMGDAVVRAAQDVKGYSSASDYQRNALRQAATVLFELKEGDLELLRKLKEQGQKPS